MTTDASGEISEEGYKKLIRVCHMFSIKELQQLIDKRDDCFPSNIKSAFIQKVLTANRLDPIKMHFIHVLEQFLHKCKITDVEYTKYLQNLTFQDVILHKKKSWLVVELLDAADPDKIIPTESQIKSNILRKMKNKLQSGALISMEKLNNINWCMIVEVKYNKKGVARYGHPVYFTFTENKTSLCLCTNKFSAYIDVLVESFGYSNFKQYDLNSKDVRTLHALVAKRRSSINGNTPNTPRGTPNTSRGTPNSSRGTPNTPRGTSNARKNFNIPTTRASVSRTSRNNSRYLASRSILLQEIEIKCQTDWKGSRVSKKRKKLNSVNSCMKLEAPNIGLFIESLINEGVIQDPNAAWVKKLTTTKSNVISVENEL